ncbi:MAG TPA: L-rhamnose isomerase [Anaerolinea thermolimosa]|uniref:L-rhamnose isomerase n=2 Tax=Anaerolinea thermolimosa TaxID=229919 RepID=A0A3D1JH52_9CHLR|nr:L-rhamnose isomerase [Anaerolinea thermolimosa]
MGEKQIEDAYRLASERYALLGVDTERAIQKLSRVSISLHCWQGDDVGGFESTGEALGGGLAATGNYPGKARTPQELRDDLDMVYRLLPGKHRLNLHAMYAETGGKPVDRAKLLPEHFKGWVDWARANHHGLDFNPSLFSHPKAADGLTLSHPDEGIRQYWIDHCIACRKIGAYFGESLGSPCVTNIWIPDGFKDNPFDRKSPRERLLDSLDRILSEKIPSHFNLDAVEGKLFGIGAESYTTGSHEFYLGYAVSRQVLLTLDSGHFHPTETIADKLSAVLLYVPEVLLHVSRGVRWDSDHVVTFTDDLQAICQEVVRGNFLERVHIGLDYFDASINRVAAWVIGARNTLKALLMALLEPADTLRAMELNGDFTGRLALMEELKGLPFGAVWDYYCLQAGVPVGEAYLDVIRSYEKKILAERK